MAGCVFSLILWLFRTAQLLSHICLPGHKLNHSDTTLREGSFHSSFGTSPDPPKLN
jgi:hypothetical protein